MGLKGRDGITLREHLDQVSKQLGREHKDAIPPPLPPQTMHIWGVFLDLSTTRFSDFGYAGPITFQEILAWSNLTGINLKMWEMAALKKVDQTWLSYQGKKLDD